MLSTNMSNSRVALNSKLTVVSSRPVSSSGKAHALSALDRGMGSHTLHVIYYYKNEENWFESFDLNSLRESLSEVLTLYPTVTGRLGKRGVDGGWEVKCNDAGVRVIKASVDATLDQWLKSASGSEENLLVAWDHMPDDPTTWSPFRIQVSFTIKYLDMRTILYSLYCIFYISNLNNAWLSKQFYFAFIFYMFKVIFNFIFY